MAAASPAAAALTPEAAGLQQRLEARRAACKRLLEKTAAAQAERDAAQQACLAGVAAAKLQLARLRAELDAARRLRDEREAAAGGGVGAGGATPAQPSVVVEAHEERTRREALELKVRTLQYELAKWRHQAEVLTANRPKEEAEIVRLKAQLTHATDVLESTRNAARHAEVDAQPPATAADRALPAGAGNGSISTESGSASAATAAPAAAAASCVEAMAERQARERAEERNAMLQGKLRRLTGIAAAQRLLIQRLEKQILKEEGLAEWRGTQLAHELQHQAQLKVELRRRSDDALVTALGLAARGSRAGSRPPAAPPPGPGGGEALVKSASVPLLPPIGP